MDPHTPVAADTSPNAAPVQEPTAPAAPAAVNDVPPDDSVVGRNGSASAVDFPASDEDHHLEDFPSQLTLPVSKLSAEVLRRICKDLGASPTGTKEDCVRRVQAKLDGRDTPGRTPYEARKRERLISMGLDPKGPYPAPPPVEVDTAALPPRSAKRARTSLSSAAVAPHPGGKKANNGTGTTISAARPKSTSKSTTTAEFPSFAKSGKSLVYITSEDVDRLFHTAAGSSFSPGTPEEPGLITVFLAAQVSHSFALRPTVGAGVQDSKYSVALDRVQCWSVGHSKADFASKPTAKSLREAVIALRKPYLGPGTANHPAAAGPWWHVMQLWKTGTNRGAVLRLELKEVDRSGMPVAKEGAGKQGSGGVWYVDAVEVADDDAVEALDKVMGDMF